jgi:Flp pilus assembly protein TadG
MQRNQQNPRSGQAIVMVTLALFAMCGILGLAVDLGWSFFIRRNAQAYADAAALAAVEQALRSGQTTAATCAANVNCTANGYSCASSITSVTVNLDSGCLYAKGTAAGSGWQGFIDGTNNGATETSKFDSGLGNPPGLTIGALYWARSRVSQTIPQLFSAILGNTSALVGGTATAAVLNVVSTSGVWGLDRSGDTNPTSSVGGNQNKVPNGADLWLGGSGKLSLPGRVNLASNANGAGGVYSGSTGGSGTVTSGGTYYNSGGATSGTGWTPAATAKPDSSAFTDPMAGKISPPVPSGLPACPIDLSALNNKGLHDKVLGPGIYYPSDSSGNLIKGQIPFGSNVTFAAGGSCTNGVQQGSSGFGNYIILGGLANSGSTWNFEPGRYVLAGVQPANGSSANPILNLSNQAAVSDLGTAGAQNTDAGEVFVLTDYNYQGLSSVLPSQVANSSNLSSYQQGYVNIAGGSSQIINLHGLNTSNSTVQADNLDQYGPLLFWQDRRNSTVQYNTETAGSRNPATDGYVACGNYANSCPNSASQLTANGVDSNKYSPVFNISGGSNQKLYGVIYQPRGSLFYMQGGGSVSSPLPIQVITGAIYLQGSAELSVTTLTNPIVQQVIALVQ